jgi:hypothetical protein
VLQLTPGIHQQRSLNLNALVTVRAVSTCVLSCSAFCVRSLYQIRGDPLNYSSTVLKNADVEQAMIQVSGGSRGLSIQYLKAVGRGDLQDTAFFATEMGDLRLTGIVIQTFGTGVFASGYCHRG